MGYLVARDRTSPHDLPAGWTLLTRYTRGACRGEARRICRRVIENKHPPTPDHVLPSGLML